MTLITKLESAQEWLERALGRDLCDPDERAEAREDMKTALQLIKYVREQEEEEQ